MTYQIEFAQQSAQSVLSIRTRAALGDLPRVLGVAFGSIAQYLGELGEDPSGAPFVAYYNMDMEDLELEIGFPVAFTLPGKDEIKPGAIPGGPQVSCIHRGPYACIEPAYDELTRWAKQNGYTPTGVAYEFYLNDPGTMPEEELLTRVMFLLK